MEVRRLLGLLLSLGVGLGIGLLLAPQLGQLLLFYDNCNDDVFLKPRSSQVKAAASMQLQETIAARANDSLVARSNGTTTESNASNLTPSPQPEVPLIKNTQIPCHIHQQWSSRDLPPSTRSMAESWKRDNPDCKYTLWTDDDIAVFMEEHFKGDFFPFPWKELQTIERADFFRYAVIWKVGGVYADIDTESLRPLHRWGMSAGTGAVLGYETGFHLHEGLRKHVGFARNEQLEQWLFAGRPGHPIFLRAMELVRDKYDWGIENIVEVTGPGTFSDAAHEYLARAAKTRIRPKVSPKAQEPPLRFPPGQGPGGVWLLSAEEVAVPGFSAPQAITGRSLIRHGFLGSWKEEDARREGDRRLTGAAESAT